MHAAAYRALRLPHSYEAIRATPEELPGIVQQLRDGVFDGLNVTVPHKMRVLDLADESDATARACGAANTLLVDGGQVIAHNTDWHALGWEIDRLAPELAGSFGTGCAIVLGTGGAARAAVAARGLLTHAPRIVLRGRAHTDEVARELSSRLGEAGSKTEIVAQPFAASPATEKDALLVVQATPLGMEGGGPGEEAAKAIAWNALPERAAALDVVYAPPETAFLKAARAREMRAANGLGMLVGQGARAFEMWLLMPAPIEAMRAAIG
jgi:shikimate dehydrogenase